MAATFSLTPPPPVTFAPEAPSPVPSDQRQHIWVGSAWTWMNRRRAYELPICAQYLAQSKKYNAILCLGILIKGETAHFEYIAGAVSQGVLGGEPCCRHWLPLHRRCRERFQLWCGRLASFRDLSSPPPRLLL